MHDVDAKLKSDKDAGEFAAGKCNDQSYDLHHSSAGRELREGQNLEIRSVGPNKIGYTRGGGAFYDHGRVCESESRFVNREKHRQSKQRLIHFASLDR